MLTISVKLLYSHNLSKLEWGAFWEVLQAVIGLQENTFRVKFLRASKGWHHSYVCESQAMTTRRKSLFHLDQTPFAS